MSRALRLLAVFAAFWLATLPALAQDLVVYHVDDAAAQATKALRNRGLRKDQFILDADYTPSGVVRIAQLQSRERYAYIKP